jgi:hypothetical protein
MRALSTLFDVTVFLLLVGGAIGTLVVGIGQAPPATTNNAAGDARLMATATTTINYSLAPAARNATTGVTFHRQEGADFNRTAHGTYATLIADAAVANATVDGRQFSRLEGPYVRAVLAAIRGTIGSPDHETNVVARWVPYPNAPVAGTASVGTQPPPGVRVNAVTLTVDSGMTVSGSEPRTMGALANKTAAAIIDGRFPPREATLALRGQYPVSTLTAQQYRRAGTALGVTPVLTEDGNASTANARLRRQLAARLERDLQARYSSPAAAADALRVDRVRIVVRTWSP